MKFYKNIKVDCRTKNGTINIDFILPDCNNLTYENVELIYPPYESLISNWSIDYAKIIKGEIL